MDVFIKKKRSEIMSKIRSENTKVEKLIFRELRKQGIYFQRHYKKAIGKPDIALPKKKRAIFIDGDFWHGRNFLRDQKRLPQKYWREKIKSNMLRDKKNKTKLKRRGWSVLRIWEKEVIQNPEREVKKVSNFLLKDK